MINGFISIFILNLLDKELVEAWVYDTKSKSLQEIQKRFRTMIHLGNYMLPLGFVTYIPKNTIKIAKPEEPHIFTDAHLEDFFQLCDGYKVLKYPPYRHLVASVMFRMIYCCGLRNSEACHLKCCDINPQNEQMTGALLDRLLHHCHLLMFDGESDRMKTSLLRQGYHKKYQSVPSVKIFSQMGVGK